MPRCGINRSLDVLLTDGRTIEVAPGMVIGSSILNYQRRPEAGRLITADKMQKRNGNMATALQLWSSIWARANSKLD